MSYSSYYQRNRDRIREKVNARFRNNVDGCRDKRNSDARKAYALNIGGIRDKKILYAKKWHKENYMRVRDINNYKIRKRYASDEEFKRKRKESNKRYEIKNADKIRHRKRKYREEHRGVYNAKRREYRKLDHVRERERLYKQKYNYINNKSNSDRAKEYREKYRVVVDSGGGVTRVKNRDLINAKHMEWYYNRSDEQKKRDLECARRYKSENREMLREKAKKYREEKPEMVKKWREKNKDRIAQYRKEYYAKNRDKILDSRRKKKESLK